MGELRSLITLPIDYSKRKDDYGYVEYQDVTFYEDFGPIKKGSQYNTVTVCLTSGTLVASNGNDLVTVKFKLTPI